MKATRQKEKLAKVNNHDILSQLLDHSFEFNDQSSNYAPHNFHAFAAKFPPQIPKVFIEALTDFGEVVLDPMMGSGTTIVEALLSGRQAIGCDIDPLATKIARVKSRNYDFKTLERSFHNLLSYLFYISWDSSRLEEEIFRRFSGKTKEFINYWYLPQTQRELMALIIAIEQEPDPAIREFFETVFSSIIITKSGGVSRARDLAHSRPHLYDKKNPREAIGQFKTKAQKMLSYLSEKSPFVAEAKIYQGDARQLPLEDESVDLIVTSPPYANAIDYMRAHKFSLVWLGSKIDELSEKRSTYIGSEKIRDNLMARLPNNVQVELKNLASKDSKKAKVLAQYYIDMDIALAEMRRVLKNRHSAIVVIGTSTMRGLNIRTHLGLAEIARQRKFKVVGIKKRMLDRNRRMMPARIKSENLSIENRMHEEYIIGLIKENMS
jgi:DNA modification methylase